MGQFLKGDLYLPTLSVKHSDLLGTDRLGQIGENKHVPITVACGLIEMNTDTTQPKFVTFVIPDEDRLFRYRSLINAAHSLELFQWFPGQISTLSYDETGGTPDDPEQEVQGAEVAIFNPTVTGLPVRAARRQACTVGRTCSSRARSCV